jgi:hypothetical protein
MVKNNESRTELQIAASYLIGSAALIGHRERIQILGKVYEAFKIYMILEERAPGTMIKHVKTIIDMPAFRVSKESRQEIDRLAG